MRSLVDMLVHAADAAADEHVVERAPAARRCRGLRTATVSITGTPSSRASSLGIELSPSRFGQVDHVERDDVGRPSAISCSAKRR